MPLPSQRLAASARPPSSAVWGAVVAFVGTGLRQLRFARARREESRPKSAASLAALKADKKLRELQPDVAKALRGLRAKAPQLDCFLKGEGRAAATAAYEAMAPCCDEGLISAVPANELYAFAGKQRISTLEVKFDAEGWDFILLVCSSDRCDFDGVVCGLGMARTSKKAKHLAAHQVLERIRSYDLLPGSENQVAEVLLAFQGIVTESRLFATSPFGTYKMARMRSMLAEREEVCGDTRVPGTTSWESAAAAAGDAFVGSLRTLLSVDGAADFDPQAWASNFRMSQASLSALGPPPTPLPLPLRSPPLQGSSSVLSDEGGNVVKELAAEIAALRAAIGALQCKLDAAEAAKAKQDLELLHGRSARSEQDDFRPLPRLPKLANLKPLPDLPSSRVLWPLGIEGTLLELVELTPVAARHVTPVDEASPPARQVDANELPGRDGKARASLEGTLLGLLDMPGSAPRRGSQVEAAGASKVREDEDLEPVYLVKKSAPLARQVEENVQPGHDGKAPFDLEAALLGLLDLPGSAPRGSHVKSAGPSKVREDQDMKPVYPVKRSAPPAGPY